MRQTAYTCAHLLAWCLAASCAMKQAATENVWILPLSARDGEQVCVITMDYPGRRCATVADIRSYLRSVKAD